MLKTRILTAAALLAVFLSALFLLPPAGWRLVVACVIGAAAAEWAVLCGLRGPLRGLYAAVIAGLVWSFGGGLAEVTEAANGVVAVAAAFWLLGAPLWLRFWEGIGTGGAWAGAGAGVLLGAGIAAVQLRQDGAGTLLAVLAVVWIADSAAYFAGRAFGRRKLAPSISPGKTWEGVAGAVGATGLLAILVAGASGGAASFAERALSFTLAVVVLVAVSIVGDLFESALKRRAGVKDSGSLLPGHGGVLDRVDSLLSALPVAAVLTHFARAGV
ncbi:MAG TPA: phosphatidate cytidylyltransferase [Pelomicrobium sp.]|nr:phosphatidate cytidylyltransferase [Pelomicrobium sp.]